MTRETKAGIVVTCSFLSLVGVVLLRKLHDPQLSEASSGESLALQGAPNSATGKPAPTTATPPTVIQASVKDSARELTTPPVKEVASPPAPVEDLAEKKRALLRAELPSKPSPTLVSEATGPVEVHDDDKGAPPSAPAPPLAPTPVVTSQPQETEKDKDREVLPPAAVPVAVIDKDKSASEKSDNTDKTAAPKPTDTVAVTMPVEPPANEKPIIAPTTAPVEVTPVPAPVSEDDKKETPPPDKKKDASDGAPSIIPVPKPAELNVTPPPALPMAVPTPPATTQRTDPKPDGEKVARAEITGTGLATPPDRKQEKEPVATPKTQDRTEDKIKLVEPPKSPETPVMPVRTPVAVAGPPTGSRPVVESFGEEEYHCKAGDTFASVSKQKYGTDRLGEALRLYNRNDALVGDRQIGDTPRPGQILAIPDQFILEKRYGGAIPGLKGAATSDTSRKVPTAEAGTGTVVSTAPKTPVSYTVRGDAQMMRDVARLTLGDAERWREIYTLNRGFDPAYRVPAGTVLQLPADARVP